MKLQIVTPAKLAKELDVLAVTVPTASGEITILPRHQPLISLVVEGIVSYRSASGQDMIAIGGGYVQTDGTYIRLLVSRSYGQHEINAKTTAEALEQARRILAGSKDKKEIREAQVVMRRSIIDTKLMKRRKHSAHI